MNDKTVIFVSIVKKRLWKSPLVIKWRTVRIFFARRSLGIIDFYRQSAHEYKTQSGNSTLFQSFFFYSSSIVVEINFQSSRDNH